MSFRPPPFPAAIIPVPPLYSVITFVCDVKDRNGSVRIRSVPLCTLDRCVTDVTSIAMGIVRDRLLNFIKCLYAMSIAVYFNY